VLRTFVVLFKKDAAKDVLCLWIRSSFCTYLPYWLYDLVKFDMKVLNVLLFTTEFKSFIIIGVKKSSILYGVNVMLYTRVLWK